MRKGLLVLLKDSTKHRANWRVGRIVDPIIGKDGVTRGYRILIGNGYTVERPFQLICDLEIGGANGDCDSAGGTTAEDREHQEQRPTTRPRREARQTAENRLVGVVANENEED